MYFFSLSIYLEQNELKQVFEPCPSQLIASSEEAINISSSHLRGPLHKPRLETTSGQVTAMDQPFFGQPSQNLYLS